MKRAPKAIKVFLKQQSEETRLIFVPLLDDHQLCRFVNFANLGFCQMVDCKKKSLDYVSFAL